MMKSTNWFPSLLKIFTAIYIVQSLMACANIVPPSGGPRDSIPPYRIVAKPKDSAVQVSPKEILIGFNEYITTNSLQENVIVSPLLKNNPLIEAKLNTIRIRITDTLAPNTTYQIQFGTAIRDVNEGNIAQNFKYVFSTGDHIDSGRLQGTVHLAETGRVDSTLIVVLHPIGNDSAIFKSKPLYYAKLNGKGKFAFDFLPFTRFNLFVVPNDYNKKYDDSTKLFAFADSAVTASRSKDSIHLYAFQAFKKMEKKKAVTINNKALKRNTASLKFSKNLDGGEQDLLHPLHLSFEVPIQLNDSFPIVLADTFNKPLDNYTVRRDSLANNIVVIQYPWQASMKLHLLVPQKSIKDSLNNILLKSDTVAFTTKALSAYGSCLIRISGYDQFSHPILLLTQDDKVNFSYPITQSLLNIAQLPAGEYQLKILQDSNQNGKWDTGMYGFGLGHQQPEKVIVLPYKLNIRADWDNELNLVINK